MERQKKKFFLHTKQPQTKQCKDSSSQNNRDIDIKILENSGTKYVLDSRALTKKERFDILYWRMATPEEVDWCKKY